MLSKRYSLNSHPNVGDPKALGRHKDNGERLIKSNIRASIPTTQIIGEPKNGSRLNFAIERDRLTFDRIMAHMFTSDHPLMKELAVGADDYRAQLALFKIKVTWSRARVLDFHGMSDEEYNRINLRAVADDQRPFVEHSTPSCPEMLIPQKTDPAHASSG